MSNDEYEDSLSEVEVLQARISELEARLARQEEQSGASANNEALLRLASAALAEEGDKQRTVCDESVDGRSFPAPRLVSDDVTQPEVVVDTAVSAHLPAAVVASSSASAPEVVMVADVCRSAYRSEVADEIESMSAARRPGRLKVRFDSVHCSDSSEPDSEIEGQYDRSRKKSRSHRARQTQRSPSKAREGVHSRGRESHLDTSLQNRDFHGSSTGWDMRVNRPQSSATEPDVLAAGQTGDQSLHRF